MLESVISARTENFKSYRRSGRLLLLVGLIMVLALALPAVAKHRPVGGELTVVDFEFGDVTIPEGTNILFKNEGPEEPHTLSSDDFLFESGAVLPGRERVVNTERLAEGEYEFFCGFHPFMRGTLVVSPSNP